MEANSWHSQPSVDVVLSTVTGKELKSSKELTSSLSECVAGTLIVLDGPGGSGKTRLLDRICKDLSSVPVDLSEEKWLEDEEVLTKHIKSAFQKPLSPLSQHVLFLFDAFHDFITRCKWDVDRFFQIIKNMVLNAGCLLIASRPSGVECLYRAWGKVDCHYVIEGFSTVSMNDYFRMSREHGQISRLLVHHSNILPGLCKVPLISSLLVEILEKRRIRVTNLTITEIVYEIVLAIIDRELKKEDRNCSDLYSLIGISNLSNLAFLDLLHGSNLDSLESFSLFLSAFSVNNSLTSVDEVLGLNLMYHCEQDSFYASTKKRLYWFLTPEIRDFLAAFYLHRCRPLDQLYVISENVQLLIKKGYSGWLQFFYGLTVKRKAESNRTRMMMSSLNNLLAFCLDFNESLQLILFIQCMTETREPTLWKKFLSRNPSFSSISLSEKDVKKTEVDLVNLINHSGYQDWVIEVSSQVISTAERLQAFVTANLEVRQVEALGDQLQLWPKIAPPAGEGRQEKLQATSNEDHRYTEQELRVMQIAVFFSRATREMVHRALQLYTGYKVSGDSSSASYVSFFSCACFQSAVEDKIYFQPIIPWRFFPVENASRKASKKGSDATTTAHLKEEHANEGVELVILLFPSVKSVRFVFPNSDEEIHIILSGKHMPDSSYNQLISPDLEKIVQCSAAENYYPSSSETVLPGMPLNMEVSSVLPPPPFIPPRGKSLSSTTEHATEKDDVMEITVKKTESSHSSLAPPTVHHAMQVNDESGSFLKVPSTLNTSKFEPQESMGLMVEPVQQQHSRRLATIKPGTVIFSANSSKFPVDCEFPLPDLSTPIQSGGNGQVFACTIQGMELIMKRTSFRSKEYSIISKVRHKNVIQLIAFVMGEENSLRKKRYFCYHVIPQLKGDLARMVTDHKELLLANLYQTHVNDHSLVGTIQSNTAMVLSNVLKGLVYLHSLHVAHRDIKASNILLKPHCSCTNPILCLCTTTEWEIVICDFDAAVQLDIHDQLPPVTFPPSQTMLAIAPQYHSVPVGTNGYRAPECSMFTTTNFPESFSPSISTQCDMFSFGLLCQRLMIGAEGPYRQRELALLLLYYHQSTGCVEGKWRLEVSRTTVNEVLKLNKLRSKMNWFPHALDLVERCLKLNPQERYPANQLLLHQFFQSHSSSLSQQQGTSAFAN